jgi:predicted small integral membrane protein
MFEDRTTKAILVASLVLFALLGTLDNLTDYDTNYALVRHALSMGTTFPVNPLLSLRHLAGAVAGRLWADHLRRAADRHRLAIGFAMG